jgi:hypothetical protein
VVVVVVVVVQQSCDGGGKCKSIRTHRCEGERRRRRLNDEGDGEDEKMMIGEE